MSVHETTARVQDQVLGAIKLGQDAVLSAVDTLAEKAGSITEKLPDLPTAPFADRMPKPADVVDSYFTFAQKMLANQKDFTSRLVDAYRPAKVSPPAAKRAAKAA
jgi:hypothetical protein